MQWDFFVRFFANDETYLCGFFLKLTFDFYGIIVGLSLFVSGVRQAKF